MANERIELNAADYWELVALLTKVENARLVLAGAQGEALAKVRRLGVDPDKPWKLDPATKTIDVTA